MANKKTDDAQVLKYFADINKLRKDAMMKSYQKGGLIKCQSGCGTTTKYKSKGTSKIFNKRSGDGLNIGGDGELGKKLGNFVHNIGDGFNRLKPKVKAAVVAVPTVVGYGIAQAVKRAKRKNG